MAEKDFGQHLRELRRAKGWTKEEFCGDEKGLSVRQLTRIETGKSKPGLDKLLIIADRLEINVSALIGEEEKSDELPAEYLKLKYQLIRTTSYGDHLILHELDEALDLIFEKFYEELPESEQFIVDILQSKLYTYELEGQYFGTAILDKYLPTLVGKKQYSINDLLVIDLYQSHLDEKDLVSTNFDIILFNELVKGTLRSVDTLEREYLFKARDVLLFVPYVEFVRNNFNYTEEVLKCLENIMITSQDYQQKPLLKMMEWEYFLGCKGDVHSAEVCYREAIELARLFGNSFLVEKLKEEWKKDTRM